MDRDRAALSAGAPQVRGRLVSGVALTAVGGFIALFYLYPLATILVRARSWEVLTAGATWSVIWFTFWQAVVSTLATMTLGLPIAGVLARYRFVGRTAVRVLATVPFVLPTVVVASAFLSLERTLGLEETPLSLRGGAWGIIAAHVYFNIAVVVRTVGGWWSQLDDRPEAAARTLGASPWRTFVAITLPRLRPALLSAGAITFLFTFTSFGVVLILGNLRRATLETEIWRFATQRTDIETAAVLGVVQLAIVLVMVAVNSGLQRRLQTVEAGRAARELERRPRGRDHLRIAGAVALVVVVLGGPLAVLVERSLRTDEGYGLTFYRALGSQDERIPLLPVSAWTAVWNSVSWAAIAAVIATIVGTVAAVTMTRVRQRTSRVLDIALLLPLGTSAVLVGFGILIALDDPPVDFRTEWWIVPVAQAVIGVPFVMRSVLSALRAIDPSLREAAATLGAPPVAVWREIDLPIISRGLVVGASFAFAISVGEFGATAPRRPA